MPRLLVLGFYDKKNLGDEMFKEVIPKLVPDFVCEFKLVDTLLGQLIQQCQHSVGTLFDPEGPLVLMNNRHILDEYDAIVCGGGDLFNRYFMDRIRRIVDGYPGPVYALGMGIPFRSMINMRYESSPSTIPYYDVFDHIFLRERTDLPELTFKIGARYAHYLPDVGFLKTPRSWANQENNIGVFLAQNMNQTSERIDRLVTLIQHARQYGQVKLFRFCTLESSTVPVDDGILNTQLYDRVLGESGDLTEGLGDIINDLTVYSSDQMIDLMSKLDMAICGRFHAHIFATIAGCPFLSIADTRKVKLFLTEEHIAHVSTKETNPENAMTVFDKIWYDRAQRSAQLSRIARENHSLLQTLQVNNLLLRKDRRRRTISRSAEDIYQCARKTLFKLTGYDSESGSADTSMISSEDARKVSAQLCYDITNEPGSRYEWGTTQNIMTQPWDLKIMVQWIFHDMAEKRSKNVNKLDLDYYDQSGLRGFHRAGWQYVLTYLRALSSDTGVLCDTFIDRTFLWGNWILNKLGVIPYTSPWIGFAHHTPNREYTDNNSRQLVRSSDFRKSLPTCLAIICLSQNLANWYRRQLDSLEYNTPVLVLHHPTLFVEKKWSAQNIGDSLNLISVGAWYRNPFSIYQLDVPYYVKKKFLKGEKMEAYLPTDNLDNLKLMDVYNPDPNGNKWLYYCCQHIQSYISEMDAQESGVRSSVRNQEKYLRLKIAQIKDLVKSVEVIDRVTNTEYDDILTDHVVFLDLIDASAVNTVIECIVRETPVIVNELPAVQEYLGKSYPLYYRSLDEAASLLDPVKINEANQYLKTMDKSSLKIETFLSELVSTDVYQNMFTCKEGPDI